MFKKLRKQLACIGCSSPSEAYRKVYLENNSQLDTKPSQRRLDLRSSLGVHQDPSGQPNGAPNTGHRYVIQNSNGSNNPEEQNKAPHPLRSPRPRRESETAEYSRSFDGKPTAQKQYQTYPYRRNRVGKRPLRRQDAVDEWSELDEPHIIRTTSSLPRSKASCVYVTESDNSHLEANKQTLVSDNDIRLLHQFKEDRTSAELYNKDNSLEDKNNKRDSVNQRHRSRNFVSNACPSAGGASPRKRSLSVSDSDGFVSSISGAGVENTLVSLVKHEWHSQVNVNNVSCQLQNGGSLKGILKRRSWSYHQVNGDSDGGAAERKPRTNSVSFVDTKFNESQLFSSSRYKKDDDVTAATKRAKNGPKRKQWASGGGSKQRSGRSHSDGKPPLPEKPKSGRLSKALSKYESLRTAHDKSPPLNPDGREALERDVALTPDSGSYASSVSSGDGPSETIYRLPDCSEMRYPCAKDDVNWRVFTNGERLGEVVHRTNRRRRSRRRRTSASVLLDKVDPDESTDSRTTSSQNSDDSSGRPLGANRNPDLLRTRRTRDPIEGLKQSAIQDGLESSGSGYVSSSDRTDDGCVPDPFWQNASSAVRQRADDNEEGDKTLSDGDGGVDDEHDRTLSDYVNKMEIGRQEAYATHVIADVEEPLPCHGVQRREATSVENLQTGRKVTAFNRVVIGKNGNRRHFDVENLRRINYAKQAPNVIQDGTSRGSVERNYNNKSPDNSEDAATYSGDRHGNRQSLEETGFVVPTLTSERQHRPVPSNPDLDPDLTSGSPADFVESDPDYEEMSDLLQHGTDDDLKSFLDHGGFRHVLISRDNIRIGRLILNDDDNASCMCAGSYKVSPEIIKKDPPYCKPVTIQVYRGMIDKEDRINILKNVMALRRLRHRRVHYVYGMALEGSPYTRDGREVMILHERTHYLVTLKKLLTWARENNPELVTLHTAVTLALQLCEGLHYLEKKGIIHGNLSSHTVRLDNYCNIKVGGIEQFPVSSTQAPIRWMSLETLNTGNIQPRSIVWTFGVLLWEIASLGARPYQNLKTGLIVYRLNKGYRLPCPANTSTLIYDLLLSCWKARPEDRPTFAALHKSLTRYRGTLPPSKAPSELFPDREDYWSIVQGNI